MVRGGAMKEENAEMEERKRLKRLALKNNLLSDRQASSATGSHPSKIVMKHHGKDIMKKSQRSGKNRFLFSFPGLLAPISGGKIGELKDLGTKNPILYLDFPQGQMKLFGTIVYPKNRYLTLQFSKSGKNVIVFSDAWWIGRRDDNPEEARLEFPTDFNMEQIEYDFKGGAGGTYEKKSTTSKPRVKLGEEQSPKLELQDDSSESLNNSEELAEVTPTRHSARMAGKAFKFAEASAGEGFVVNGGETSEEEEEEEKVDTENVLKTVGLLDIDKADAQSCPPVTRKRKQPAKSALKTKENSESNKVPLVQATISTLFKKAGEKAVHTDVKEKEDDAKVSGSRRKGKAIEQKKAADKYNSKVILHENFGIFQLQRVKNPKEVEETFNSVKKLAFLKTFFFSNRWTGISKNPANNGTENTAQKKKAKVQLTAPKKLNKQEVTVVDSQEVISYGTRFVYT
ncbi:hypothetical protein M9H77_14268 [Catharanthus roseus]|uniref:Uncharacterized protein n=1 Tax=Catharanthus roseus TaxID=4058 RepID=A0ACC0BMQ7_CATRO|nr:hypothetical protein M9H77_14268 [Catharanthus roseus]